MLGVQMPGAVPGDILEEEEEGAACVQMYSGGDFLSPQEISP